MASTAVLQLFFAVGALLFSGFVVSVLLRRRIHVRAPVRREWVTYSPRDTPVAYWLYVLVYAVLAALCLSLALAPP